MIFPSVWIWTALGLTVGVWAQDYSAFPAACSTQCAAYVKNSYLCGQQYPVANGTDTFQACFCDVLASAQVSTCSACLTANKLTAAAKIVNDTPTTCTSFAQGCVWQCSFKVCNPTDLDCQCTKSYLQDVYNCGSCNTNNKRTGGTQRADYDSLFASCQGLGRVSVNDAAKSTDPLPSPTPTAYVAPSLTGHGLATTTPVQTSAAVITTSTLVAGAARTTTTVVAGNLPTTQAHAVSVATSSAPTGSAAISLTTSATTASALPIGAMSGSRKTKSIGSGAVAGLLLSIVVL